MGIPQDMRDYYRASKSQQLTIPSPAEDAKIKRSKDSTHEGVIRGAKAAAVAAVVTAVPVLVGVRKIPWAKANINHTGQALIISSASIAAFFITADKSILETARKNTHYEKPNSGNGQ